MEEEEVAEIGQQNVLLDVSARYLDEEDQEEGEARKLFDAITYLDNFLKQSVLA